MHEETGKRNRDANDRPARLGRLIDGRVYVIVLLIIVSLGLVYVARHTRAQSDGGGAARSAVFTAFDNRIESNAQQMLEQGRQIFRYDTFGDETYWTDKLKLHRAQPLLHFLAKAYHERRNKTTHRHAATEQVG